MKFRYLLASILTSCVGLASVNAQSDGFDYYGAEGLGALVLQVVFNAEGVGCGDIFYQPVGTQSRALLEIQEGFQQTTILSTPLSAGACSAYPDAKQVLVARERMPVAMNNGGNNSCDTKLIADVPGYQSDAPAWAEALQLVYGGADGEGTMAACSDSARRNLIENWGNLWSDSCGESGKCSRLRFAFRQGDDSEITRIFKSLVGVQAFCNGSQNQDQDPIRTDCSEALDVNWCPDGDLGVVQALELSAEVKVFPRLACVDGDFDFSFQANPDDSTCTDGTPPFAGFLCAYPRNCRGQFGCINNLFNGSPFAPFMDGREYNNLGLGIGLDPIEIPNDAALSFIYMNGNCTGGSSGAETELQVGCLVHEIECTMAYGSGEVFFAPVTSKALDANCSRESVMENSLAWIDGLDLTDPNMTGWPLSRPIFMTALDVPERDGVLDCDQVSKPDEQALCKCMFRKSLVDFSAEAGGFEKVPEFRVVPCGELD